MADAEEQDLKEVYNQTIKSLVPINELSPQLQNEVIRNCEIYRSKKKEFIFKQGARDSYSFYLLDGQIELLADKEVQSIIVGGTDSARYAMVRLQPRQFSARAKTEVTILQIERSALDRLMVADQQKKPEAEPTSVVMEVSHIEDEDSGDWMTKMLQSELFSRLPTANIHQLFALLEPVEFKAGDVVIKQGDTGDFYYIIQEGRSEVTRAPVPGAKPIKLAELKAGDCFGEEALLTNATRNASITMKTDGILMQLSKDNFINLIKKPTLEEVNYVNAKKLVEQGAVWLDVRFPNEYEESHIEGSINISLNALRMQTDKLKQDKKYIIYCDTGGRSSAAAFLLTDRGFKVSYLKDGLSSVPQDTVEKKTPAPAAKAVEKAPGPVAAPVPDEEEDADLITEIRSSIIETNLAKTNLELDAAKKKLAESNKGDNASINEARKKLEAEKKKLESEKKAAEKENQKLRDQEAENLKKLKREAEERLTEEKKKLEEVYARNTVEMEKLQRMKQEAEEQIKKEREKLEMEAAAAKKQHQETEKLKQQLEESRRALEQQAEKKRAEQEAMEKAIQAKAKAKLEQERRKMADEFARSHDELDKAQKAKAMAEAARTAAQDEAKKIIDEYKKQFDQERTREQARIQEERKKLEEESKKIRQALQDIQKSKQQAVATEAEAQEEVQKLRKKQQGEDITQNQDIQKLIAEQIRAVEARMLKAKENAASARQAEEDFEAVRVLNEEEIKKQKEIEERMRSHVEADLAEFLAEHKHVDETQQSILPHSDHIKRIKERAAAAKKAAEQSTDSLFSDIASQLGQDDK